MWWMSSSITSGNNSTTTIDDENEEEEEESFTLRQYQRNALRQAIKRNVFVCLPTGAGKTLIAINLIKNRYHQTDGKYPEVAKRSIFVAPTRQLVEQQTKALSRHLPFANVEHFHGDKNVDFYSYEKWMEQFDKNTVLVFTPQVVVDILKKAYITVLNFNLLIIDEAHHVYKKDGKKSKHPYRQLMDLFHDQIKHLPPESPDIPRVLALSASPVNQNLTVDQIETTIQQLETIYSAKFISEDTTSYHSVATVYQMYYDQMNFTRELNAIKNKNPDFEVPFQMFDLIAVYDQESSPMIDQLCASQRKMLSILNTDMGPWFAIKGYELLRSSLENFDHQLLAYYLQQYFTLLCEHIQQHFVDSNICQPTEEEFITKQPYISERLYNLLKIFESYHNDSFKHNEPEFNCILFVRERIDANIIYRWLVHLSTHITAYSWIKPGFVCGSSVKDFIRFDRNTSNFKKKFEEKQLNLLVATSVLEEGIDVPICNIVIRYDIPHTYCAYVQSKGRARDMQSRFILMVDKSDPRISAMIQQFGNLEAQLKNIHHALENSDDEEEGVVVVDEVDALMMLNNNTYGGGSNGIDGKVFYTKSGAQLHENDCIHYVNQYIQKLPSDYFVERRSQFYYLDKLVPITTSSGRSGVTQKLYCCLFIMPINSSLNGHIIKGDYRISKFGARSDCAYKVCLHLYHKGEIDDHLNIRSSIFLLQKHSQELNFKLPDRNVEQANEMKTDMFVRVNAKYCERLHQLCRQSLLQNVGQLQVPQQQEQSKFYLYQIDYPNSYHLFEQSGYLSSRQQQEQNSSGSDGGGDKNNQNESSTSSSSSTYANTTNRIGILTTEPLPMSTVIESFIYLNENRIQFRIIPVRCSFSSSLSAYQLKRIRFVHRHLTEHVITAKQLNKDIVYHGEDTQKKVKRMWTKKCNFGLNPDDDPNEKQQQKTVVVDDNTSFPILPFYLVPLTSSGNYISIDYNFIERLATFHRLLTCSYRDKYNHALIDTSQALMVHSSNNIVVPFNLIRLQLKQVICVEQVIPLELMCTTTNNNNNEQQQKERTFEQYFREEYKVELKEKNLPMFSVRDVRSFLLHRCKFSVNKTVPRRRQQQNSRTRTVEKNANDGDGGDATEDVVDHQQIVEPLQQQNSEDSNSALLPPPPVIKHHTLYPPELLLSYPLSMAQLIHWNTIPSVLYRLEQYLIAYQFLQHVATNTSTATTTTTNSDGDDQSPMTNVDLEGMSEVIDLESLLTTTTATDGSKLVSSTLVSTSEEDEEEEDEDDSEEMMEEEATTNDNDNVPYKLVEVNAIDENNFTTHRTTAERLLSEMLPGMMQQVATQFDLPVPRESPLEQAQQQQDIERYDFNELKRKIVDAFEIMYRTQMRKKSKYELKYENMDITQIVANVDHVPFGSTSMFNCTGNNAAAADITTILGDIDFDTYHKIHYPNPWYIVKAFTLSKSNDIWNLEQLETLGDAFLKMNTALYLYTQYQSYDEGKLTRLKEVLVSNAHLHQLALNRGLERYCFAQPFRPSENWTIPFYPIPGEVLRDRDWKRRLKYQLSKTKQMLKYKNIADLVEAILGAFVLHGSLGSAVRFIEWLDLRAAFHPARVDCAKLDPVVYFQTQLDESLSSIKLESEYERQQLNQYMGSIDFMVQQAYRLGNMSQVERTICYVFNNKYYLVQAFTHPSFDMADYNYGSKANLIASYQRLEFIGDALLDYLITYYVYKKNPHLSPMEITNIRMALVNNTFYASTVVKHNLHGFLRQCGGTLLQHSISHFVRYYKYQMLNRMNTIVKRTFKCNDEQQSSSGKCDKKEEVEGENDEEEEEEVSVDIEEKDAPKTLGDIFEALCGAIFFDCGMSLNRLWSVVYPMIQIELHQFMTNVPINPLFWLESTFFAQYHWSEVSKYGENRLKIELTINDNDDDEPSSPSSSSSSSTPPPLAPPSSSSSKQNDDKPNVAVNNDDDNVSSSCVNEQKKCKKFPGFGTNRKQCKLSAAYRAQQFYLQRHRDSRDSLRFGRRYKK